MFALNLPAYACKIKTVDGKQQIFDPLRHRYVALTPEEWVRQHFCHFLINNRHFPAGRFCQEYRIRVNGQPRRCDTVVFDAGMKPLVIVEYKAPEVEISQAVFDQIVRYNWVLRVPWLMVSNGLSHYCCHLDYENQQVSFLPDIPFYDTLEAPQGGL